MAGFLVGAISFGVIFLFGCVGEIIMEKAGHLNLGLPGIMCMGTAGGCWGAAMYINSLSDPSTASGFLIICISIITASVFAMFAGMIYAFLTVSLRANQNVTGLALTTFGAGFAQFFMDTFVDRSNFATAGVLFKTLFSFAGDLGWFGEIFFSHGFLVYFAIILALLAALFLRKTKKGLNLSAIGESPATADAAGINVTAYKYIAIVVGSAVAGLGGLFYVMNYMGGKWDNTSIVQSMGWLAIALVIFTMWKPDLSIIGSFIFGALYICAYRITGISNTVKYLLTLLPYVITIIVLIITSSRGSKNVQPPASLGLNYFREDR